MAVTSCPDASRLSVRCDPINPAPPVISTFKMSPGLGCRVQGVGCRVHANAALAERVEYFPYTIHPEPYTLPICFKHSPDDQRLVEFAHHFISAGGAHAAAQLRITCEPAHGACQRLDVALRHE